MSGFKIFFLLSLTAFFFACEDFQTQNYEIDAIDAQACTMISDTTFKNIPTKSLAEINAGWTLEQLGDSAAKAITILKDSLQVTISALDSAYQIIVNDAVDSSYLALSTTEGMPLLFYVDDFIKIDLIDSTGVMLGISDETMSPELVGGCLEMDKDVYYPVIKTRYVYKPEANKYLLRIIKTDQTEKSRFKTAVLNK
ncbi:MAG: hypothetical protein KDF60_15165 [Calditrichaeota bacterium]|nr:hypothetical protein [Calditrichota bacterium]